MTQQRRDDEHKSEFSKWLRDNKRLDSIHAGLSIIDFDWIIHQYKVRTQHGVERQIQNMMCVEEKRYGKDVSESQRDTLIIIRQILMAGAPMKRPKVYRVWSTMGNKYVDVRYFGYHLLQFSGYGPTDSKTIEWDRNKITVEQLEKILRFELSPITLRPRDERSHHGGAKQRTMQF